MTKLIRRLLLLALCTLAAGCADAVLVSKMVNPPTVPLADASADAEAKRCTPQPDLATIYIIREDIFAGQAILFDALIDGRPLGRLARGTYFKATVPPGRRVVSFSGEAPFPDGVISGSEPVDAEAGSLYFLVLRMRSGPMAAPTHLERVDEAASRPLLAGARLDKGGD